MSQIRSSPQGFKDRKYLKPPPSNLNSTPVILVFLSMETQKRRPVLAVSTSHPQQGPIFLSELSPPCFPIFQPTTPVLPLSLSLPRWFRPRHTWYPRTNPKWWVHWRLKLVVTTTLTTPLDFQLTSGVTVCCFCWWKKSKDVFFNQKKTW